MKPQSRRRGGAARYRAWRGKLALSVLFLAVLFLAFCGMRRRLGEALAGWTGEEDPKAQLRALYSLPVSWLHPVETRPLVPIAHTGLNPYGVNTFLEQEVEEEKIRCTLSLLKAAGFGWIRQQFPWRDIEIPRKGEYWDEKWAKSTWEKYDRIVALAEEYGLGIIARLDAPPDWSRQDNRWFSRPPDDPGDYGDFVYTIVRRYRGRVKYYQIWNEPNIYPEWGEQAVDPAAYARLLKIGYTRAKEADPNCVILAAGLAPTIEIGPKNLSDLVFLEEMYKAGAKDYFDIMSVMAYGLWTGPGDRRAEPQRTNFSRPQLVRQIMVRYGDEHKPIWASEVGWNALPSDFKGEAVFGRVSEEHQALYAARAYQRAQAEWPWMGAMAYWFAKRADDHERDQPMYYFRMFEPDCTPHPVYYAMKELATRPPAMHLGFHQESHWALRYRGNWQEHTSSQATLGRYQEAESPGDALSFTFIGSELDLIALGGAGPCQIEVKVDELPGRRMLLEALPLGQVRLPLARGLRSGSHRVEIKVLEGPLRVDGFIVWRSNSSALRPGLGAGATGLSLLGSAYLFGRRHER